MARFVTHTGLVLEWEDKKVTLGHPAEPSRTKLLYPLEGETYTLPGAAKAYNAIKSHYEEREQTDPKADA